MKARKGASIVAVVQGSVIAALLGAIAGLLIPAALDRSSVRDSEHLQLRRAIRAVAAAQMVP